MGHYSYDEALHIASISLDLAALAGDVHEEGTLERIVAAISEAPTAQEAAAAANRLLGKHLIDGPGLRHKLGGVN